MWVAQITKLNEAISPEVLLQEILGSSTLDLDEAESKAVVEAIYDKEPPRYIHGPKAMILSIALVLEDMGFVVKVRFENEDTGI